MSNIVEKVARAICAESWSGVTSAKEIERLVDVHWPVKAKDAKAAITTLLKAMEEPSEGMVEAGDDCYGVARGTESWVIGGCKGSEVIYKAMLAKFREEGLAP